MSVRRVDQTPLVMRLSPPSDYSAKHRVKKELVSAVQLLNYDKPWYRPT